MAESAEQEQTVVAESQTKNSGNKLVMIIAIVNFLATLGIAAMVFIQHQNEAKRVSIEDIALSAGESKTHASSSKEHGSKAAAHEASGGHGGGHGEGHGDSKDNAHEANVDAGKMITLEPFTVNLATAVGSQPRYVRLNLTVELEEGADDSEFKAKTPRVRDTVINLLNSKKPTDLATTEGRELLKDEMKRSLNGFLTVSKVKGLYFTNFAISN
jgi:flagellar basal body-associated protein FliL